MDDDIHAIESLMDATTRYECDHRALCTIVHDLAAMVLHMRRLIEKETT